MWDANPKLPPQNLDAERCAIASAMLDPAALDDVADILQPEHFYTEAHRTIYAAIRSMRDAGHQGIDAVTVAERLANHNQLAEVGGAQYVVEVLASVPHSAHAKYYSAIVRDCWRERRLVEIAQASIAAVYDRSKDTDANLADLNYQSQLLMENGRTKGPEASRDFVVRWMADRAAEKPAQRFVPTGWPEFDNRFGGIREGRLTTAAALTGAGKTVFAGCLALNAAAAGVGVLLVSYEMTTDELTTRFVSNVSRVPFRMIEREKLAGADAHAVALAAEHVGSLPIEIDDTHPNELELYATIRLAVRRRNARLLLIDYLQLVEPKDPRLPRERQVAEVSRSLVKIAQQSDCAILALSQLNRDVSKREDKRPRLSDIRESGSIANDSSMVLLLHRPGMDADSINTVDDHAVLTVAKNRAGERGEVRLSWHPACAAFRDEVEGLVFP